MRRQAATLRPLRMGEILDRAIRLYRRHFFQYLGIIALVQVPLSLVQIGASLLMVGGTFSRMEEVLNNPAAVPDDPFTLFSRITGPGYAAGASLSTLVTILSFVLVQGLATAALTRVVAGHYLGKPEGGVLDAFRRIKGEWFSLLGALLLALLLMLGLLIWWFLVPCVGWISGLGMVSFLGLVIIPLLAPVVILEKQPATAAWRRAWALARRRFWWVFLFGLVLYLFNLLLVAGPAALVGALAPLLAGESIADGSLLTVQTMLQSVATLITSLFYLPLQVAAMTVLYLDLRVRTEGIDLLLQVEDSPVPAAAAEGTGGLALPGAPGRWLPASGARSLLTGREFGYFSLVTVGLGLLLILVYAALFGLVLALGVAFGGL